MTHSPNPNDIWWLARYAHNETAPLFAQVKAIEPALATAIDIRFHDKDSVYGDQDAISISAWWSREGMFQLTGRMFTKADVDVYVDKLAKDVAALKPLEVGIAA